MRKFSWLLMLLLTATIINYPNPFNPNGGEVATIECTPDTTVEATLYIYDMSARLFLRQAFNLTGGTANRTTWNGYSDYNELVGNGIYLYQIIDANRTRVGKGKIWVVNQ
ncbi:T9SS type A sorting domain-containing protein [Candidatus Margulisiibacteriota bacterium]